jgi:hypothetical protein
LEHCQIIAVTIAKIDAGSRAIRDSGANPLNLPKVVVFGRAAQTQALILKVIREIREIQENQ